MPEVELDGESGCKGSMEGRQGPGEVPRRLSRGLEG